MNTSIRSLKFVRCTVALAAFAGGALAAAAQSASPAVTPKLDLTLPKVDSSEASFSSSLDGNADVIAENHFDFVSAAAANAQPGQRRYGRPRYRGGNTNADGSSKYDFFGGVGLTQPVGNTYHYLTPSYGFQVGGGRQFNQNFALDLQFDYDHFGFNGRTIASQYNLYNQIIAIYNSTSAGAANPISPLSSLDGSTHVWSFTLDPRYTFDTHSALGGYIVGGVGFYHKVANFTTPGIGIYYDPYYGPEAYVANQTIDHYTSNAPGFNGGFGLTYKFSRFSNERFFAEARYVIVLNSQRQGVTLNTVNTANYNTTNDYPANSNRTTYVPIKFGVRF